MLEETATFVLPLNSAVGYPMLLDSTNNGSVKFAVNWDSFFNGMNDKYRRCRLRYKYIGNPGLGVGPSETSILTVIGLVSKSSGVVPGVVLGPIMPTVGLGVSANTYCLVGDDISAVVGQDIVMPKNRIEITVNSYSPAALGSSNSINTISQDWVLLLYFELYDPIV